MDGDGEVVSGLGIYNMSRLGASADKTQSDDNKIRSRRLNGAVRLIVSEYRFG